MKALVLGATGQLGANLVRALLDQGYEVRAFHRPTSKTIGIDGLPVERAIGNLDDFDSLLRAMHGCQVLFHAAPYYPVRPVPVAEAVGKALSGLKNVLKAAKQARIERTIFTSALITIGSPPKPGQLADENCPFRTPYRKNPYLMAKFEMEGEVRRAVEDDHFPAVIINPTTFFGPYDSHPTSGTQIVMMAKYWIPFYVEGRTNVVDVRDVARGAILALERGRVGERYILGAVNTTQGELGRLIARTVGRSAPVAALPFPMVRLGSKMGDLLFMTIFRRPPPVPSFFIEVLRQMQHYDISKARQELGYSPGRIEPAIQEAFRWFQQNGYV